MIENIDKIGNGNARALYEAALPASFARPTPETVTPTVEHIARQKYEQRLWASSVSSPKTTVIVGSPVEPAGAKTAIFSGTVVQPGRSPASALVGGSSGAAQAAGFSDFVSGFDSPASNVPQARGGLSVFDEPVLPARPTAAAQAAPSTPSTITDIFAQPVASPSAAPVNGRSACDLFTSMGLPRAPQHDSPTQMLGHTNTSGWKPDPFSSLPSIRSSGGAGCKNRRRRCPRRSRSAPWIPSLDDWPCRSENSASNKRPFAFPVESCVFMVVCFLV